MSRKTSKSLRRRDHPYIASTDFIYARKCNTWKEKLQYID